MNENNIERIDLRIKTDRNSEAAALEKIRTYDREKYRSMSDYIIHAVNAYEAPVCVLPDTFINELRKMFKEELVKERDPGFM